VGVVAVEEGEDSTALGVGCQAVWEVVVAGEVLHKASLVGSLSNDKMPMRRVPSSARETTKLMTTNRRAIGQSKTDLPETNYRTTNFNGLEDSAWDSYSQAFSFRSFCWPFYCSWGLGCTVALK
jgi:hypothetical protein